LHHPALPLAGAPAMTSLMGPAAMQTAPDWRVARGAAALEAQGRDRWNQ